MRQITQADHLQETEQQPAPSRHAARLRQLLPLTLGLQDAVLIYVAFCLAYWVRYSLQLGPTFYDSTPFADYQVVGLLILCIMISTLLMKGAYRTRLSTDIADEALIIISAATISVATLVVITTMLHKFAYSRGVIVYLWILLMVMLVAGRALHRSIRGLCHRKGWAVERLLVVGASDAGKMIMQSVMGRPDLGYEIVGFVDRRGPPRLLDFGRFQALGTIADIPELIRRERIDEVIVALPPTAHEHLQSIVQACGQSGARIKLVPDLLEVGLSQVQMDDIAGLPLLDVQEKPLRRVARAVKRGIDILVAAITLLLAAPLVGVLALLIKLESHGPVFIRQERVGHDGRRFFCFKLRTMRADADQMLPMLAALNEASGHLFKIRNDPRCTKVGRFIRRWSLDEIPQAWNVLKGDMSLVGPRPPLPREVVKYDTRQMRRLETKPGLTGIWQVSGRSDLAFDEMVMMDIMYIDNWSLALDLKILIRTAVAVVAGRGAY